jgi:hypothetical protein
VVRVPAQDLISEDHCRGASGLDAWRWSSTIAYLFPTILYIVAPLNARPRRLLRLSFFFVEHLAAPERGPRGSTCRDSRLPRDPNSPLDESRWIEAAPVVIVEGSPSSSPINNMRDRLDMKISSTPTPTSASSAANPPRHGVARAHLRVGARAVNYRTVRPTILL